MGIDNNNLQSTDIFLAILGNRSGSYTLHGTGTETGTGNGTGTIGNNGSLSLCSVYS